MGGRQADAIVIGGGPGGASTAACLAMAGQRVVLFEKERFPRFHIGESLLPAAWPLWDRLGVTKDIEQAGFLVKQGVNFGMFNSPKDLILLTAEFPEYFQRPYTYHVDRARFDRILLDNARRHGADVCEEWTVADVLFEGDRAVGVRAGSNGAPAEEWRAPVVVDATGRDCLIARKLGLRKPDPALNKLSHFTHFTGGFRRPNPDGSTMTDIHSVDGGWIWFIPLAGDVVSVGVVLDAKAYGHLKGPQQRFDHAIGLSPRMKQWLEGAEQKMEMHTISNISYLNDRFVGDGWILVGDASMFVDPIFSAGVTLAIRGGIFAADAILDAHRAGDFSRARLQPAEDRIRPPMAKIFRMIYNWYKTLEKRDPNNVFERSRTVPILRERLIVLLSGGYDKVDMDSLLGSVDRRT